VFDNPHAAMLALAPVPPAGTAMAVRERLKQVANRLVSNFHEPPLRPGARYARTAVNVADDFELRGFLLMALAQGLLEHRGGSTDELLRMGPAR
jgi:hypothetical protein